MTKKKVVKKEVKPTDPALCPSCLTKGKQVKMTKQGDKYMCNKCQTWVPVDKVEEGVETEEERLRKETRTEKATCR